jgi:hypothetical protein
LKLIPSLQDLTGQKQDVSVLLVCAFWEPVYYNPHNDGLPSNRNEGLGHWVGVALSVGDVLTLKILSPSNKVILRSVIRSALDATLRHKRHAPLGGESNNVDDKLFVRSKSDIKSTIDEPSVPRVLPTIEPKDRIERYFLKDSESDGQSFTAGIMRTILDHDADL